MPKLLARIICAGAAIQSWLGGWLACKLGRMAVFARGGMVILVGNANALSRGLESLCLHLAAD